MDNKISADSRATVIPSSVSSLDTGSTIAKQEPAKDTTSLAATDVVTTSPDPKASPDRKPTPVATLGALPKPTVEAPLASVRRRDHHGVSVPTAMTTPFANYQLLSSAADVVDNIAAVASDKLAGANRDFLSQTTRFAIAAGEFFLINRSRLLAHEYGHAAAAREVGLGSHLEYFDFFGGEGVTMLEGPATPEQLLAFQLGGLNQSETNVVYLHEESARRGELTLGQAFTALASALDDTSYIAVTARQDAKGDPWKYADSSNIQASFARFGKQVTYEHQLRKALVADLLSSLNWESALAAADYVRTGQSTATRKTYEVAGQQLTGPDVALLRSIYGDNFRIMVTVNPGREGAWDVRLDLRTNPDDWAINAVGARLQKLDAVKLDAMQLTISPYVGVSRRLRPNDIGTPEEKQVGDFGFTYRAKLTDKMSLIGDAGVGKSWDGALKRDSHVSMAIKLSW